MVGDKFADKGRRRIDRALDAYSSWRESTPIAPVAPELYFPSMVGSDDVNDEVVALLKEHDPLCSGAPAFASAGLAIDPDAVVLAQVIIAASIQTQASNDCEDGGRVTRMEGAVGTRAWQIAETIGVEGFDYEVVLAGLTADWEKSQRMLLLIESASSNPFAPYDIAWYPDQEVAALAHLATVIGLPASTAHEVTTTFTQAASAHKKISIKRAGAIGLGTAAALGSAGFLAAPAIGAAVGSAAGLSGAAATSYGLGLLGSLGGASVPGTLTAGGMWLVTQAGVAAGAAVGAGGSVLYSMGAGQAQNEIIKLQVTYKLVLCELQENDARALDVYVDFEKRIADLEVALEDHQELSDPGSPAITSLEEKLGSLKAGEAWIDALHPHEDDGSVYIRVHGLGDRLSRLEEKVWRRGRPVGPPAEDLLGRLPASSQTLIEDRMQCRFASESGLDRFDVIAAIGAGIAGAAVDAIIVGDPTNGLTARLRSDVAVRGGNWLEDLAKVPYDTSIGEGLTPSTHRVLTPGHDPLLGLVIGTRDILQSTMTRSDIAGAVQFVDRPTVEGSASLFAAVGTQIAHLLSDVVTPAGLPLPGWTALTAVPSLAEPAVKMYAKGYDTWHLAPMSVPVAAIHAVGAAYWLMREDEYVTEARRDSFTLLALGIASMGDLSAMLATSGNPLAINYVMWLELARRTAKQIRRQSRRSAVTTLDDIERNQHILNHGWSRLLP